MPRLTTKALLATVLTLVACDGDKKTPTAPESLSLARVSGNNQQGYKGQTLVDSLVVAVTDDGGSPAIRQRVDFEVVAGDATVEPETGFTDSSGYARTRLTLGTSTDSVRVSATTFGHPDTVYFTAKAESRTEATVQVGDAVLSEAAIQVGGDESGLTYRSISGDQVSLSVSGHAHQAQVGDILVNTKEPYFLRRVVRVVHQTSEEVVVETEQASLTEVVKQVSIHEIFRLPASGKPAAPSHIQGRSIPLDGTTIAATGGVGAQVTSGSIAFDPEYEFRLEIDEWALEEFLLSAGGQLSASLELRAEASVAASVSQRVTVPPGGLPSHYFVFWAGWVPVVVGIQPVFSVGVEVSSAVEGSLIAGASVEKQVRIGVQYSSGSWQRLNGEVPVWQVSASAIDFRGEAEVRSFVEAQVNVELYDIAGPHLGLQPYLALSVATQPQSADWVLEAGVDAYVGAHIEVLDNVVAGYSDTLNWARTELTQGSIDLGGGTTPIVAPDLVVDGLQVDPVAPTSAQPVVISVRAANVGMDAADQAMVVLLVDGVGVDSAAVDLAAGSERVVAFDPVQLAVGSYSLDVVVRPDANESRTLNNRTAGTLSVTGAAPASSSLVFLLDLSDSMNNPVLDGSDSLLVVARQALEQVLGVAALSGDREYALVTFGGDCGDGVRVPAAFTTDHSYLASRARSLTAYGLTPLAEGLRTAQHLALDEGSSDAVQLVLLSDGEETCGGDPLSVAQAIGTRVRAKPLARVVQLNAIGLGLEPGGSEEQQIQAIASAAGGDYFRMGDPQELQELLSLAAGIQQTGVAVLSGRISGLAGEPIREASVWLKNHPGIREQTNAEGVYSFPLELGFLGVDSLIIVAENYERKALEVILYSRDKDYPVSLDPGPELYPVAQAEASSTVVGVGTAVTLIGTGSRNPAGGDLVYRWSTLGDNPTATAFMPEGGETAAEVQVELAEVGRYGLVLVVGNEFGLESDPDTVYVEAVAQPLAVAEAGLSVVGVGSTVTLSGARSHDPVGGGLVYRWSGLGENPTPTTFTSGGGARDVEVEVQLSEVGTYRFVLVVASEQGLESDPDTIAVVSVGPPVATAEASSAPVGVGSVVTLIGTRSHDPAGGDLVYRWSALGGNPAMTTFTSDGGEGVAEVEVELRNVGTYGFTLVVENGFGLVSAPDTVLVETVPIPVAVAEADSHAVRPGEVLALLGGTSHDPAGGILVYHWSQLPSNPFSVAFPDNDSRDAFAVRVTLTDVGTYRFVLVVENELGILSNPDTLTVRVPPPFTGVADLGNGVHMDFVWIKPGTFTMGEISVFRVFEDEMPPHNVTITRGFWLGKYETTQRQWEAVMERSPWADAPPPAESYFRYGPNYPAGFLSWSQAQELVDRLNDEYGRTVYRLPTEAEWEYACRAGTTTRWSFGDDYDQLGRYAWYNGNTSDIGINYAQTVGMKQPNPWGLYDMHGNVLEWCQDWYGNYQGEPAENPQGPERGFEKVLRGGSHCCREFGSVDGLRSARRFKAGIYYGHYTRGVRLLRME